jgi:hypothetical protein
VDRHESQKIGCLTAMPVMAPVPRDCELLGLGTLEVGSDLHCWDQFQYNMLKNHQSQAHGGVSSTTTWLISNHRSGGELLVIET